MQQNDEEEMEWNLEHKKILIRSFTVLVRLSVKNFFHIYIYIETLINIAET